MPEIGDPAPPVAGTDVVSGEPFSLQDQQGSVVLLAFSGITWCGPCKYEAPLLQELWLEYTSQVHIPAVKFAIVSTQFGEPEPVGALQNAINEYGITFPVVHGYPWPNEWEFNGVPTLYFIDPDGIICGHHVGAGPPAEAVKNAIRTELAACGVKRINIDLGRWVAIARILFGVTEDGGGLIISGGKPIPVDPWGPYRVASKLGPQARDVLRSLAMGELAADLEDPALRQSLLTASLRSAAQAAQRLKLEGARPGLASQAAHGATRVLGPVSSAPMS